jgi:hypothetical protein
MRSPKTFRPLAFSVSSLLLVFGSACGGSEPPARTVADERDAPTNERGASSLAVSSEIGALDEDKVTRAFDASLKELQRCLDRGARRVEFIGGAVSFYVKVDGGGALAHTHVEESSLGDRETEKCMLDVLRKKKWPAPVGGETGYARKSFEFDPPNDVRPPTDWSGDRVAKTLDDKSNEIAKCKNGSNGSFTATMYVSTSGQPLAVGITPPDEGGEAAVDCLVDVLKSASYPKPGSWPAKVTFSL